MRAPVIACALLATGCSFALVSGPPPNHRELPVVECTTSHLGPVLDTVWTLLQLGNVAIAATQSDAEWDEQFSGDPPWSRKTGIGLYAGFAALGAAGMYFGYTRTSSCRAAKAEWLQRGGATNGWGTPAPQPQPQPGTWPPPQPQPQPQPQPGTWPPPQPAPPPSTGPAL